MFKLIGLMLLFCTTSMWGICKTSQFYRRKRLLNEFQEMAQTIHTEMGYFKEPLPEIFKKLATAHDRPTDFLLKQCLINHEMHHEDFSKIWETAVKNVYTGEPLNARDMRVLCHFGSFIGQSGFDSQKGHFALFNEELAKQIHDAEENIRKKGSLYTKAGISIGAVLAIALL